MFCQAKCKKVYDLIHLVLIKRVSIKGKKDISIRLRKQNRNKQNTKHHIDWV